MGTLGGRTPSHSQLYIAQEEPPLNSQQTAMHAQEHDCVTDFKMRVISSDSKNNPDIQEFEQIQCKENEGS